MSCNVFPNVRQTRPLATIDNHSDGVCGLVFGDPVKCGHVLSLSLLLLGIVFLSVGMLRPRPYVFDPNMAARDMEAIETRYAQLSRRFDLVLVAGMLSVTAGGIAFTFTMVVVLWSVQVSTSALDQQRGACQRQPDERILLRPMPGIGGHNYGCSGRDD